ncbi:MAG: acyltransferase [Oscillospiraceae bacterium]|nr:acyltransferase [Oscillospiraceae bacterium]
MKERYNSIEGLRVISCFAIIAMHILYNTSYGLSGNIVWDRIIPSWTWFVYLFLMISGFGMCAGYLERMQKGTISMEDFYKKRYKKILPFFGFLILIAVVMEHSISAIFEASVELPMLHGLLPNNHMSLLGVCWTLGVIFLFYLLFPFFSWLMKNKKTAWLTLIASLWINYVCENYFFGEEYVTETFTPRHSFIYCIPLFVAGGLIYLYRKEIRTFCSKFRWIALALCVVATVLWYVVTDSISGVEIFFIKTLLIFSLWLSYAVGVDSKFLGCKFMRYFSGISMEMYLAQMIIFRVVEKLGLLYVFGNSGVGGWISFAFSFILTVVGLVVFIQGFRLAVKIFTKIKDKKFSKTV